MAALLAVLFAVLQPVPSPAEPCEGLFQSAGALYVRAMEAGLAPSETDALAEAARRARTCYGTAPRERIANLYAWEAYALLERGRVYEAETALEGYFSGYTRDQPAALTAYMRVQIAGVYLHTGRPLDALASYRQAALLTPEDDPAATAELALNTALAYEALNDPEAALEELRRADQVLGGNDSGDAWLHYLRARVWSQEADLLLQEAEDAPAYEAARAQSLKAVAAFEEAGWPDEAVTALMLAAESESGLGRAAEAVRMAELAATRARALGEPALTMRAVYKLGRVLAQARRFEAARGRLEEAYAGAAGVREIPFLRRIGTDLGLLAERTGDRAGAERWFRDAIARTEQQRAGMGTSAWSARAFSGWEEPYRGLVRVLLAEGRAEEAFLTLETMRARRLQDLRRQASTRSGLPPALRARADSFAGALTATRSRLLAAGISGRERSQLEAAEIGQIRAFDTLFEVQTDAPAPTLAEIQRHLKERGAVLLSYFAGEPDVLFGRNTPAYVFRVTGESLSALRLPGDASEIERAIEASGLTGAEGRQVDLRPLHRLHEMLVAPALRGVPEGAPLLIVPDSPLGRLPFAALVGGHGGPFNYAEADFLIERHPISMELAATLLLNSQADGKPRRYDAVALGRSTFEGSEAGPGGLRQSGVGLAPLPGARREVEGLCGLFRRSRCVLDDEASETELYEAFSRSYILHLASHTLLSGGDPLSGALLLSADNGADGLVHAHELLRRPAAASLVVLTNCASASGRQHGAEGVLGLPYAFRASGSQSVVATLWPVDDRATAGLMDVFYRELRAGAPKDVALQRAQVSYLRETGGARLSPFFWAAPTLYGDPGALPLREGTYRLLLNMGLIVASVAILAVFLVLRWHRRRRVIWSMHV